MHPGYVLESGRHSFPFKQRHRPKELNCRMPFWTDPNRHSRRSVTMVTKYAPGGVVVSLDTDRVPVVVFGIECHDRDNTNRSF
jgi:hypothetical protein